MGATAGITQDVGQDPTVGFPDFCTLCGQEIFCEICGQETDRGCWLEVPDADVMNICTPTPPMTDPPSPDGGNEYFPAAHPGQQPPQLHPVAGQLRQMHLDSRPSAVSQQEEVATGRTTATH